MNGPSQPRLRTTIAIRRTAVPDWLALSVGVVRIDGERAGLLIGGKPKLLYLAPGPRKVRVQLGAARSEDLDLDLGPGEHAELICGWSAIPAGQRPTGTGRIVLGATLLALGLGMLGFPLLYFASPVMQDLAFRVVYAIPILDELVLDLNSYIPSLLLIPLLSLAAGVLLSVLGLRWHLWRNRMVWVIRRPADQVTPSTPRSPLAYAVDETPPESITNACVLAAIEARKQTAGLRRGGDGPSPALGADSGEVDSHFAAHPGKMGEPSGPVPGQSAGGEPFRSDPSDDS